MESSATDPLDRFFDYRGYEKAGLINPNVSGDNEAGDREPDDATGPGADSGPVRVLVVDDQPDVLATTVELFKLMGYEVLSADNGLDAIEILKRSIDIQVLFSDVVMPGMNGVRLAQEARKLIPGINVILASGFQGGAMGTAGADMGDFHFLIKPFRIADVARVLRK